MYRETGRFPRELTREISELAQRVEQALGFDLYPWQKDYIFNNKSYPVMICPCIVFNRPDLGEECTAMYGTDKPNIPCPYRGRRTGLTTAHIIKLSLSDGPPISLARLEDYLDIIIHGCWYTRVFYRREFLSIWQRLKEFGIKVRPIKPLSTMKGMIVYE